MTDEPEKATRKDQMLGRIDNALADASAAAGSGGTAKDSAASILKSRGNATGHADRSPFTGALRREGARGSAADGSTSIREDVARTAKGAKQGAEIGAKVGGAAGAAVGGVAGGAVAVAGSKRGRRLLIFAIIGPPLSALAVIFMTITMLAAALGGSIEEIRQAQAEQGADAATGDGLQVPQIQLAVLNGGTYGVPWEILAAIPYVLGTDPTAKFSEPPHGEPAGPYGLLLTKTFPFAVSHGLRPISVADALEGPRSARFVAQGLASEFTRREIGNPDLNTGLSMVGGYEDLGNGDGPYWEKSTDPDEVQKFETLRDEVVGSLAELPIEAAPERAEQIYEIALTWHMGGRVDCGTGASASSAPSSVDGVPQVALEAYVAAEQGTGIPWNLIAAIAEHESHHGTHRGSKVDVNGDVRPKIVGAPLGYPDTDHGKWDLDRRDEHAVGPLQFIPTTWATMGWDADGRNGADPHNIFDAAYAAGRYFAALTGGDTTDASLRKALARYSGHGTDVTSTYVVSVMDRAAAFAAATGGTTPAVGSASLADLSSLRAIEIEVPDGLSEDRARHHLAGAAARADALFVTGARQVSVQSILGDAWNVIDGGSPRNGTSVALRAQIGRVTTSGLASLSPSARAGAASTSARSIAWADVRLDGEKTVRLAAGSLPSRADFPAASTTGVNALVKFVNSTPYPLLIGGEWGHSLMADPYRLTHRTRLKVAASGEGGFLFDRSITASRATAAPGAPDQVGSRLNLSEVRYAPPDGTGPAAGPSGWVLPLPKNEYTLTSLFGETGDHWKAYAVGHSGTDFAAPLGTKVYAIGAGQVTLTKSSAYGPYFVTIDHGSVNGQTALSRYAHLSKSFVRDGDNVTAGQLIGEVGEEGNATGPHLHLEVILGVPLSNGDPAFVDPLIFLETAGSPTGGVSSCGVTDYGATAPDGAWGGYENGQIPLSVLAELAFAPGRYLRPDAAEALGRLNEAFSAHFGRTLVVTDAYRDYDAQVECREQKGNLCAAPGTSNHGWGLAVDLGSNVNSFDTAEYRWMALNAATYGWLHPSWAERDGRKPEPWHWQFGVVE